MTLGGILFMIFGWGLILILTAYCFVRVAQVEARKKRDVHVGDPERRTASSSIEKPLP